MPNDHYHLAGFDCGKADMVSYLLDGDANRDAQAGFSVTGIALHGDEVAAYISILGDAIRLSGGERPTGIPYHTAPALKVGRLAVCSKYGRCGVGKYLIDCATGLARATSRSACCRYLTLDAHQDKVEWYGRLSFQWNQAEARSRKIFRHVLAGVAKEKDLPNVSMRFDLFLEGDLPPPPQP